MIRKEALEFPKSILIETYSLCQGECKFCPYKELRSGKEQTMLTTEKFLELLYEISQYGISRLTLFNNNEPLLDKRIYGFVKVSREMLPNVEIGLSSNGRAITKDVLYRLIGSNLSTLYISIPCVNREDYKNVMDVYPDRLFELLDSIEDEKLLKMVRIAVPITKYLDEDAMMQRFNKFTVCIWNLEYKASWGIGKKINEVAREDSIAGLCDRPMDQAVISSNGDVLICCRDWQGQNVVGNVYNSGLYDIWHSEPMQKIQNLIAQGNYSEIECCKDCAMNKEIYKR